MLLRATNGNLAGAAFLAALAKKESSFGATAGKFRNNFWGWGVHLGPSVYTSPSVEEGARKVWRGLTGSLYKGSGLNTPSTIINRYAPPSENNTALYQNQVNSWFTQMGLSPGTNIFGGPTVATGAAPGAGPVPPAGPPGAADLAPVSGSLDVRRLMGILNAQRQRVLRGEMPGPNYQRELGKLLSGALPRAQVKASAQQVGARVAGAAQSAAPLFSGPLPKIPAQNIPFGADPQGDYDWADGLAKKFGLKVTSGYRNPAQQRATGSRAGMRSRHLVHGGAADISGSPAKMRALADWAIRSGMFAEVFYDPLGYYWDNGRLNKGGIGGHSDHVHISYGKTFK